MLEHCTPWQKRKFRRELKIHFKLIWCMHRNKKTNDCNVNKTNPQLFFFTTYWNVVEMKKKHFDRKLFRANTKIQFREWKVEFKKFLERNFNRTLCLGISKLFIFYLTFHFWEFVIAVSFSFWSEILVNVQMTFTIWWEFFVFHQVNMLTQFTSTFFFKCFLSSGETKQKFLRSVVIQKVGEELINYINNKTLQ